MGDGRLERLRAMLTQHPVELKVHEHLRERIALYRERRNAEMELSWEEALFDALEVGLEADETKHGLFASVTGGVYDRESRQRIRESGR